MLLQALTLCCNKRRTVKHEEPFQPNKQKRMHRFLQFLQLVNVQDENALSDDDMQR